jgi:hypothetical protein
VILPSKHIPTERALIGVGGQILALLATPSTVSGLWDRVRKQRSEAPIEYNWFILAIDLLFIIGAVQFDRGLLQRETGP